MFKTVPLAVINDRYELQREIARGGMGSVWVAKDGKLRRSVAIKVMVPMWVDSGDVAKRFEREAMAVAQLQSPHVVQIFDYGVEDGCPYIVMELLEGEDLRERLLKRERLDLEMAGKIMVQTAKALSEAHAAGIVHRDLKPGNIFLVKSRDEEIVKVLDFGVAKAEVGDDQDEKTKAGTLLGTPQYMSPEQARALPNIDHRADLWSLAVIIYRAVVGRLPYVGKSAADVIVKICTQSPPRPTALAPDLPEEADRFFARALSREPAQRFESARQMAVAFSRVAPTSFPSLSMPEPMPEIGEARAHRLAAEADMDWDDSVDLAREAKLPVTRRPPPKRPPGSGKFVPPVPPPRGKLPSAPASSDELLSDSFDLGAADGSNALADALEPTPQVAGAGASGDAGAGPISDLFPPQGALPPPMADADASSSLPLAPLSDSLSISSSGAAPSSSTLASGLVDATPVQPVERRRRPVILWVVGILGVCVVAAGVTFGALRLTAHAGGGEHGPAATEPTAAPLDEQPPPPPQEPTEPPQEPTEPPPTASTAAQGGADGVDSAAPEESAAPITAPPQPRPRPRPRPRPKPKPKPTAKPVAPGSDPFSERL